MRTDLLEEAIELAEKANADLEPELLRAPDARKVLALYTRLEKLGAYGRVVLARKVEDPIELARVSGTSVGKAKETVSTAKVLGRAADLNEALKHGEISFEQAAEIAKAEESAPGTSRKLLDTARTESFSVLKDQARKAKLEAEQHRDLAVRQRHARFARTHADELGMVHIHLSLEPHVATPIVARAETEARRLARVAKQAGSGCAGNKRSRARSAKASNAVEPFDRYLADAYAALLSGRGKTRATRPELVVLVSHEVAKRGWTDVRKGEVCKIPGVGPVAPDIAKRIGKDAFLSGVFFDGKDLRHFKRWSRSIPIEVRIALELGDPPGFDGVACVDCGNRFRCEIDHVQPRVARGPTSKPNLEPRCWGCHQAKTERDRKSGKLRPPDG